MNTYTWQFPKLDVYPTYETVADAVFNMHWRLTADDGAGHTATVYGTQQCGPVDLNDFIPFADLTLAEVQGWVEQAMSTDQIATLTGVLDENIASQITPPYLSLSPPWV